MPRSGRPKAVLGLSSEERDQLDRWARRPELYQALGLRSRLVLTARAGRRTRTPPRGSVCRRRRCASGGPGSWSGGSTGCATIRGRAGRGRSPSTRSSEVVVASLESTRYALVAGEDGAAVRSVVVHDRANLAGVPPAAAPRLDLEAVRRSAVRGEGLRNRRVCITSTRRSRRSCCACTSWLGLGRVDALVGVHRATNIATPWAGRQASCGPHTLNADPSRLTAAPGLPALSGTLGRLLGCGP